MNDRLLLSTYRIQLNHRVPFAAARDCLDYLQRLGISHLYCSPILKAGKESLHGYDVTDCQQVNPELGGDDGLRELVEALRTRGMGAVLDIVPNHMAASEENPYWWDVLTFGRLSPYSSWFDLDWTDGASGRQNRLILPVLGQTLDQALKEGQLRLSFDKSGFKLCYFERCFPLNARSYPFLLRPLFAAEDSSENARPLSRLLKVLNRKLPLAGNTEKDKEWRRTAQSAISELAALINSSPELLERVKRVLDNYSAANEESLKQLKRLLGRQVYQLTYWWRARFHTSYRRFFDVHELIALRTEIPAVTAQTHGKLFELLKLGTFDAFRVDHVDGLLEPHEYLLRLKAECGTASGRDIGIYVEKILAPGEKLPDPWPVNGTTGYEFLNALQGVFISANGVREIEQRYLKRVPLYKNFSAARYQGKRKALERLLLPDVNRLARRLKHLGAADDRYRELSLPQLRNAISELICRVPVYRTYVSRQRLEAPAADLGILETALEQARESKRVDDAAHALLEQTVLAPWRMPEGDPRREASVDFVTKFQQLCAPATAKGVEETALYAYVPFAALNEVGAEPDHPLDDAVAAFHRMNAERAATHPKALLSLSTHDTKRSADVRARLDVLSECAGEWFSQVESWEHLTREGCTRSGGRVLPDWNTRYLFFQSLVAIWPFAALPPSPSRLERSVTDRLLEYMTKACREAKLHTEWQQPDQAYEAALTRFIETAMNEVPENLFLPSIARFVASIAMPGLWNALAAVALECTCPGVPDIYQGDEIWSFTLVDPDNRGVIDFQSRAELLDSLDTLNSDSQEESGGHSNVFLRKLVEVPQDGRIKLHLYRTLLRLRRELPALFSEGTYIPLKTDGAYADHLFAFARAHGDERIIIVVPRLTYTLTARCGMQPFWGSVWNDTAVLLESGWPREYESELGAGTVAANDGNGVLRLPAAELLRELPVAVLR